MKPSNLFVVSRFASDSNRRTNQLIELDGELLKTTIVRESHDKPQRQIQFTRVVDVSPRRRGLYIVNVLISFLSALGLGVLFHTPLAVVIHLGAFKRALLSQLGQAARRGERSVVIIETPAHPLATLAMAIRKRFPEVAIIIDWQDLWSADAYYVNADEKEQETITKLEWCILKAAHAHVTTNENAQRTLTQLNDRRPGGASAAPIYAIGHAYDTPLQPMRIPPQGRKDRPVRIVFLGNLFKPPKVPGDALIDALKKVAASGVNIELTVIGDKKMGSDPEFVKTLPPFVRYLPRMTHDESIRHMNEADWLMLLLADLPNTRNIMHAKLPHYLASGIPILAIVPQDAYVATIVNTCRVGVVLPLQEGLAEGLRQVLIDPPADKLAVDQAVVSAFDLENFRKRWQLVIKEAQAAAAAP